MHKNVIEVGELPTGMYFLGDPCYVVDEALWGEFCEKLSNGDDDLCANGLIFEFQGKQVFVSATNYGDGTYTDQLLNQYPVDAGIIGMIPAELCVKKSIDQAVQDGYGHRFEAYVSPITVAVTPGRHLNKKRIIVGARVITT